MVGFPSASNWDNFTHSFLREVSGATLLSCRHCWLPPMEPFLVFHLAIKTLIWVALLLRALQPQRMNVCWPRPLRYPCLALGLFTHGWAMLTVANDTWGHWWRDTRRGQSLFLSLKTVDSR